MEKKKIIMTATVVAIAWLVACGGYLLWHKQSRLDKIQVEIAKCQNRIMSLNDERQVLEDKQTQLHDEAEENRRQIENLQLEASWLLGVN